MADTIKLPPLPEPVYTIDEDGNKVFYHKARLVRARDIAVVRAVLEAALKAINPTRYANEADRSIAWDHYHAIDALKIEGEA